MSKQDELPGPVTHDAYRVPGRVAISPGEAERLHVRDQPAHRPGFLARWAEALHQAEQRFETGRGADKMIRFHSQVSPFSIVSFFLNQMSFNAKAQSRQDAKKRTKKPFANANLLA
jgi:hypothetical protein